MLLFMWQMNRKDSMIVRSPSIFLKAAKYLRLLRCFLVHCKRIWNRARHDQIVVFYNTKKNTHTHSIILYKLCLSSKKETKRALEDLMIMKPLCLWARAKRLNMRVWRKMSGWETLARVVTKTDLTLLWLWPFSTFMAPPHRLKVS